MPFPTLALFAEHALPHHKPRIGFCVPSYRALGGLVELLEERLELRPSLSIVARIAVMRLAEEVHGAVERGDEEYLDGLTGDAVKVSSRNKKSDAEHWPQSFHRFLK